MIQQARIFLALCLQILLVIQVSAAPNYATLKNTYRQPGKWSKELKTKAEWADVTTNSPVRRTSNFHQVAVEMPIEVNNYSNGNENAEINLNQAWDFQKVHNFQLEDMAGAMSPPPKEDFQQNQYVIPVSEEPEHNFEQKTYQVEPTNQNMYQWSGFGDSYQNSQPIEAKQWSSSQQNSGWQSPATDVSTYKSIELFPSNSGTSSDGWNSGTSSNGWNSDTSNTGWNSGTSSTGWNSGTGANNAWKPEQVEANPDWDKLISELTSKIMEQTKTKFTEAHITETNPGTATNTYQGWNQETPVWNSAPSNNLDLSSYMNNQMKTTPINTDSYNSQTWNYQTPSVETAASKNQAWKFSTPVLSAPVETDLNKNQEWSLPVSSEVSNGHGVQEVKVPVPQPFMVPVPVPQPFQVPIYKVVPKEVEKRVPITVEKLVPKYIEKPYKVEVEIHHPKAVYQKYPVKVPVYIHKIKSKPILRLRKKTVHWH